MNDLTREEAEEFAGWFQCLADPTRLLVLNCVARAGGPMTVGMSPASPDMRTASRSVMLLSPNIADIALTRPCELCVVISCSGRSSFELCVAPAKERTRFSSKSTSSRPLPDRHSRSKTAARCRTFCSQSLMKARLPS